MKRIITFALLASCTFVLLAQQPQDKPQHRHGREVTELVSDLNAVQKRRIESISNESKRRIDDLHQQKQAVHDSINLLLQADGDQSQLLYPLFDREAALQAAISREMYATRLRIDQVLSKEQRQQVRQACPPKKQKMMPTTR